MPKRSFIFSDRVERGEPYLTSTPLPTLLAIFLALCQSELPFLSSTATTHIRVKPSVIRRQLKKRKSLKVNPSLSKSALRLLALSTIYGSTYLYMACDYRIFMSTEFCSNVLSTADKPRHTPLRQLGHYLPRAWYLLRISLRVDPIAISQTFQLDSSFSTGKRLVSSTLLYLIIMLNVKLYPLIWIFSLHKVRDTYMLRVLLFWLRLASYFLADSSRVRQHVFAKGLKMPNLWKSNNYSAKAWSTIFFS